MNRVKRISITLILMTVLFLVACTPDGAIDYDAVFLAAQSEVDLAPTVNDDFILPTSVEVDGLTITISWASSHPNVVSVTGDVTRPSFETGDVTVTLTATFTINDETDEHDFIILVEALPETTYTVSFYHGDDLLDTKVVGAGAKVTAPPQPTPVAGYVFGGWVTGDDELWDFAEDIVTTNRSLYVSWDLITYTITYHNLGEATHPNPTNFNIETETFTLLNPAVRQGYAFVGWFDALVDGEKITEVEPDATGNIALYALWEVVSFDITYVGAITTHSNPDAYDAETPDIELQDPQPRSGYRFMGWFTDEALTMDIEKISLGSTGDLTLYAKWETLIYTISYVVGDGTLVEPATQVYTIETETFELPLAELDNHAFMGWYDAAIDGDLYESIELGSTGSIELYARYSPYYTVHYYGQKEFIVQKALTHFDNELILTEEGAVLTIGLGAFGLIGNGAFNDQAEYINITSHFSLNENETIIDIDLYQDLAIALSNEGRVFIWGYLNFNEQAIYAHTPVDITIQFDFLPDEVPTKVASFGTFSFVFTNQGVYRFEHEEAYQLNAPITAEDFSWGHRFGFGEYLVSLSYLLDDQVFLYDAYLNKDFVNITAALNLPTDESIQGVFSQDDAVHVLMETSYHFAQFQNNTGEPISLHIPLTLSLQTDETIIDVFGGGIMLTSEGRLLLPEYVNPNQNEIPDMVIYSDITELIDLNENETLTQLFNPLFLMTSEGRLILIASNEGEHNDELAFYEIELASLLQVDEVLLAVEFDMFSLRFKTNVGLYLVEFGNEGLVLHQMKVVAPGIIHQESLVLNDFDPYVYLPEAPLYQTFDVWYLDEALTIPWTAELTVNQMVLYPGFASTHYVIYLNILGNQEPYFVPFDEIPNMDDPSIEHYEFHGWYYIDENDNYVQFMFDKVLDANTYLDASLIPTQYQLTIIRDHEHMEIIDVPAMTMFGHIDFQVFEGYEVDGIYVDMIQSIPLNMEALVLSDLTLYVTVVAQGIPVYYYQDVFDASFSTIYAEGNQVFGYLTTGEFVGSGSNYDGALGLGLEDVDDIYFAIDMNEVLNLMPGETVVDMSQIASVKSLLTSESRIFVWGYHSYIDHQFKITKEAKDITDQLDLNETQSVVKIQMANTGLFIFLNDGTVKHYEFMFERMTTFDINLTFNNIILINGFWNDAYEFDHHFVVVTQSGIYEVKKENGEDPVDLTDLSSLIAGDELMFSEMDLNGYLVYRLYSKEGRRYLYDLIAQTVIEDVDFELLNDDIVIGVYNVSWNIRAILTADHRLFTLNTSDMTQTEVTLNDFNPGETIIGFYSTHHFMTNEGRGGSLDLNTNQTSFTGTPLEIGERSVIKLVKLGWAFGFMLSDDTIIDMYGNEYQITFGANLTKEEYYYDQEFTLLTPAPKEGYIFTGWYQDGEDTPYNSTPYRPTFLFAGWELDVV